MAGQGIPDTTSAPTPDWVIKGPGLYRNCPRCGKIEDQRSHQVLRLSPAQYVEWKSIDTTRKLYDILLMVAFFGTIALMLGAMILGLKYIPDKPFVLGAIVLGVVAVMYFAVIRRMTNHNKDVLTYRHDRKTAFLEQFGGIKPENVTTPDQLHRGREYVLVPDGINDELEFDKFKC